MIEMCLYIITSVVYVVSELEMKFCLHNPHITLLSNANVRIESAISSIIKKVHNVYTVLV